MISKRQIERLAGAESWSVLARRILANGRCLCRRGQERLCSSSASAEAGLGLALQRLAEITYGPDPLGDELFLRLLARQRRDGLFGPGPHHSPAASAAALKGLLVWADRQAEWGRPCDRRVLDAIFLGLNRLCAILDRGDRSLTNEADLAVILWQLADHPAFRRSVDLEALVGRLHTGDAQADEIADDLTRCARAVAA